MNDNVACLQQDYSTDLNRLVLVILLAGLDLPILVYDY